MWMEYPLFLALLVVGILKFSLPADMHADFILNWCYRCSVSRDYLILRDTRYFQHYLVWIKIMDNHIFRMRALISSYCTSINLKSATRILANKLDFSTSLLLYWIALWAARITLQKVTKRNVGIMRGGLDPGIIKGYTSTYGDTWSSRVRTYRNVKEKEGA